MSILIQISDCHIGDTINNQNLAKIVNKIQIIRVKAIVISGDLTANGLLSEYLQLKQILAPLNNIDIFVLSGNHDNNFNMQKVWQDKQLNNFTLENYHIQLINSKIINKIEGFIQIQDIDKKLKNSILITHHPIIDMDSNWDDSLSIKNKEKFWSAIKKYNNIKAIFWGHSHEAKDFNKNGVLLYSCPSTAYQFSNEKRIGFNLYKLGEKIIKSTIWI